MSGSVAPAVAAVRAPLLRVLAGGTQIPAPISAGVESNGWYSADRFEVEFALYADPAYGPGWWGQQSSGSLQLSVQVAFVLPNVPLDWQTLIVGQADRVSIDLQGGTARVEGRDLTALMIDAKTAEPFQNQSFSQIVQTIAGRHGLTANVSATTDLSGRFWEIDHNVTTLNRHAASGTEWDLLVNLAKQIGFDLWVTGTTLNAAPAGSVSGPPIPVVWNPPTAPGGVSCNVMRPHVERSLVLARPVQVQVQTYSSKTGATATEIASSTGQGNADPPTQYRYVRPNLTPQQAQAFAQAQLADLTKHERIFSYQAPADLTTTPRSMVALSGTGSSWDQGYLVDTVTRRIDASGFTMDVRCKNVSAASQTSLS